MSEKVLDSMRVKVGAMDDTYVNNPKSVAGQFSASKAYAAGDYVYYNRKLYCFTAAHAAGAWIGTDASEATVSGELSAIKAELEDTFDASMNHETILNASELSFVSGITNVKSDKSAVLSLYSPQLYNAESGFYNNTSYYIITLCPVEVGKTYRATMIANKINSERLGLYTVSDPLNSNSLTGNVDTSGLQYLIDGEMQFDITSTINGYLILRSPAHSIASCVHGEIMVSEGAETRAFQPYYTKKYELSSGDNSFIGEQIPFPVAMLSALNNLYDINDAELSSKRNLKYKIITLCKTVAGETYHVALQVANTNDDRLGLYTTQTALNTNTLSGNVDASGLQNAVVGKMSFDVTSTIDGYLVLRSPGATIGSFGITDICVSNGEDVTLDVLFSFDAKAAIESSACASTDSAVEKYETETEALTKKVREDVDSNTLVFAVTADNHYNPNTERGRDQLVYAKDYVRLAKRLGVDFALNLGDLIDQDDANAATVNPQRLFDITRIFANSVIPFVYAIGHHEQYPYLGLVNGVSNYTFSTDKVVGLTERFTRYLTDVHSTIDRKSASFYIDFEILGIRLISLDSVSNTPNGYSQAVVDFLQNEALNTAKKVLVVSHVASRASANWRAVVPVNGDLIEAALETFVSNGGTVLAHIHGHTHWDNIVKENNMSYPLISVCCAGVQKANTTTEAEGVSGAPTSYDRTNNSYSAYCMDVFCVHANTGEIHIYRFGAGTDRNYTPSD